MKKAQTGSWFFFVQMIGSLEDTVGYGVIITLYGKEERCLRRFSEYSGDICPIDASTVEEAAGRGLCLIVKDREMAKLFAKNPNSGVNEFSVLVNILRA